MTPFLLNIVLKDLGQARSFFVLEEVFLRLGVDIQQQNIGIAEPADNSGKVPGLVSKQFGVGLAHCRFKYFERRTEPAQTDPHLMRAVGILCRQHRLPV